MPTRSPQYEQFVIDRAVRTLMTRYRLTEQQAHDFIAASAEDNEQTMADIAAKTITETN